MELVQQVSVDLIQSNASDDMVAMAAWVSHDADSEDRLKNREQVKKLIHFLYRNKHMSPFEHGQFTFKIDVPLFVAREFHRHRTMSYNEVSGRYTKMQPRFWVGDVARIQHGKPGDYYFEDGTQEQTEEYLISKKKAVKKAWRTYKKRLESGMAKEQAREELPLSLMTQFYATVNPRNLMAFLTLRNDKHALKEIRMVAQKMEEIFAEQMPLTYAAYVNERNIERYNSNDGEGLELAKKKIAELENKVTLLTAEADALGVKLIEVQQEAIANRREANAWRSSYEETRDELYASLSKQKQLEDAVTKPSEKYGISTVFNDVDPVKVATKIREVVESLEKRKPRR